MTLVMPCLTSLPSEHGILTHIFKIVRGERDLKNSLLVLIQWLHTGQSLELWFILSNHIAHVPVLAFEGLPQLHRQRLEYSILL